MTVAFIAGGAKLLLAAAWITGLFTIGRFRTRRRY